MSSSGILATYTGGIFRPTVPEAVELPEGQDVLLTIEPIDRATYILTLTRQIYAGLSEEEIEEIEQIIRGRPLFSRKGNDEDVKLSVRESSEVKHAK